MGGYGIHRDVMLAAERELEARHNLTLKQKRYIKREVRAQAYAAVARSGGGAQERARRQTLWRMGFRL